MGGLVGFLSLQAVRAVCVLQTISKNGDDMRGRRRGRARGKTGKSNADGAKILMDSQAKDENESVEFGSMKAKKWRSRRSSAVSENIVITFTNEDEEVVSGEHFSKSEKENAFFETREILRFEKALNKANDKKKHEKSDKMPTHENVLLVSTTSEESPKGSLSNIMPAQSESSAAKKSTKAETAILTANPAYDSLKSMKNRRRRRRAKNVDKGEKAGVNSSDEKLLKDNCNITSVQSIDEASLNERPEPTSHSTEDKTSNYKSAVVAGIPNRAKEESRPKTRVRQFRIQRRKRNIKRKQSNKESQSTKTDNEKDELELQGAPLLQSRSGSSDAASAKTEKTADGTERRGRRRRRRRVNKNEKPKEILKNGGVSDDQTEVCTVRTTLISHRGDQSQCSVQSSPGKENNEATNLEHEFPDQVHLPAFERSETNSPGDDKAANCVMESSLYDLYMLTKEELKMERQRVIDMEEQMRMQMELLLHEKQKASFDATILQREKLQLQERIQFIESDMKNREESPEI